MRRFGMTDELNKEGLAGAKAAREAMAGPAVPCILACLLTLVGDFVAEDPVGVTPDELARYVREVASESWEKRRG